MRGCFGRVFTTRSSTGSRYLPQSTPGKEVLLFVYRPAFVNCLYYYTNCFSFVSSYWRRLPSRSFSVSLRRRCVSWNPNRPILLHATAQAEPCLSANVFHLLWCDHSLGSHKGIWIILSKPDSINYTIQILLLMYWQFLYFPVGDATREEEWLSQRCQEDNAKERRSERDSPVCDSSLHAQPIHSI